MSTQGLAFITPELMRWARERRGISRDQLAKHLRVTPNQVLDWERGDSYPHFGKAINLARVLHVPFGYLFLSDPPSEDVPLPDLRTVTGEPVSKPSTDFLDLLNSVLIKQDWYREYAKKNDARPLSFVGRYQMTNDIEEVAEGLRDTLSINEELRRQCSSWTDFLVQVVSRSESAGILVMRSGIVGANTTRKLSVKEFRGFVISDPIAPLVFINATDAKAAQTFTLVHELSHIWIGESGISNLEPTEILEQGQHNKTELFCDRVTAEVLTPTSDFLNKWRSDLPRERAVQALARHFRVSTLVILRRALELDTISRNEFFALLQVEQEHWRRKKTSEGGGGNFFNTLPARNSAKLTDTVLGALQKRRLMYSDAAKLLGVKVGTLAKLIEARRTR